MAHLLLRHREVHVDRLHGLAGYLERISMRIADLGTEKRLLPVVASRIVAFGLVRER